MPLPRTALRSRPALWLGSLLATAAALLAGCKTPPQAGPGHPVGAALNAPSLRSEATNALAYRRDAASRIYQLNAPRIWQGKMNPALYAVGVLSVSLDANGKVRALVWKRAPTHAPEVIAEIERTVHAAAPYPAPYRMGGVTWTDTWLWDASGRFQLDTLTEGQR